MLGLRPGRLIPLAVFIAAAVAQTAAEAQDPAVNYGPDVLVISTPVLTALERGLRTEIALREALRKELAAMKTPEQYEQCKLATVTSPEGMSLYQSIMTVPDNIAPDAWRRQMTKGGKVIEAFLLKKCGADPVAFGDSYRQARLREIERRAADAAGPIP